MLTLPGTAFCARSPAVRRSIAKAFPAASRSDASGGLTRSVVVDADTDVEFEVLTLNEFVSELLESNAEPEAAGPHSAPESPRELVSSQQWQGIVADAIRTIRREELEKVVLARAVQLDSPGFHAARRDVRTG